MTYNWFDTRASTWYEGYGPDGGPSSGNAGNFVDINTLSGADKDAALNSLTNNVIAMLERQGVATGGVIEEDEQQQALAISTEGTAESKGNIPSVLPLRATEEELHKSMLQASPRQYYRPTSG